MGDRIMNNQIHLMKILVDTLRKNNALENVICEYCIETVRECCYCHKLMDEGWLYQGFETYCSDACLLASHPELDIVQLKSEASDDYNDTYWTKWEG